jgi:hypothetical protein
VIDEVEQPWLPKVTHQVLPGNPDSVNVTGYVGVTTKFAVTVPGPLTVTVVLWHDAQLIERPASADQELNWELAAAVAEMATDDPAMYKFEPLGEVEPAPDGFTANVT